MPPLDPKDMAAYYHLGLAHYFLGEFGEAADAFGHAVETAPDNDERINSINWLYAALRRAPANRRRRAKAPRCDSAGKWPTRNRTPGSILIWCASFKATHA